MNLPKLTPEQRHRHDEIVDQLHLEAGKDRRRWRIRRAMAYRSRLGFPVARGRS